VALAGEDANIELALARSLVERLDEGDVRRLWGKVVSPGAHGKDRPAPADDGCAALHPAAEQDEERWLDQGAMEPTAGVLPFCRPPRRIRAKKEAVTSLGSAAASGWLF
jgi:hypothetical protein